MDSVIILTFKRISMMLILASVGADDLLQKHEEVAVISSLVVVIVILLIIISCQCYKQNGCRLPSKSLFWRDRSDSSKKAPGNWDMTPIRQVMERQIMEKYIEDTSSRVNDRAGGGIKNPSRNNSVKNRSSHRRFEEPAPIDLRSLNDIDARVGDYSNVEVVAQTSTANRKHAPSHALDVKRVSKCTTKKASTGAPIETHKHTNRKPAEKFIIQDSGRPEVYAQVRKPRRNDKVEMVENELYVHVSVESGKQRGKTNKQQGMVENDLYISV